MERNIKFVSGFVDLDKIIGGFQPSSLNVVASHTSMGKSALVLNVAQFGNNVESNGAVLFFTLEMSLEQLQYRMLSAQTLLENATGVKISDIATGMISDYEFWLLQRAEEKLKNRNFNIFVCSELTTTDFRTICKNFKEKYPDLSLIVVDYIQLMTHNKYISDKRDEIEEILRNIKSVALELQCPVIAVAQLPLSTEIQKYNDIYTQLLDLELLNMYADTVILLNNTNDNEDNDYKDSVVKLSVAKNQNGHTELCHLIFRKEYAKFINYANTDRYENS